MRIFIAVELSRQASEVALGVAADIREALGGVTAVRWVAADKMHLTVRFLGQVADDRVPLVVEALSAPLGIDSFEVVFGSCGVFPRSGAPRVIWLGVAEGFSSLAAMHDEFDRRLAPVGFEPERRPFSAHLTLARVKDLSAGGTSARRAIGTAIRTCAAATTPSAARSLVTRATIFRSHLSPHGSAYEPLGYVPLARNQRR